MSGVHSRIHSAGAVVTVEAAVDVLPTLVPGRSLLGCWCLPQAPSVAVATVGSLPIPVPITGAASIAAGLSVAPE